MLFRSSDTPDICGRDNSRLRRHPKLWANGHYRQVISDRLVGALVDVWGRIGLPDEGALHLCQCVGWVERSETHRLDGVVMPERKIGFATLYPSCGPVETCSLGLRSAVVAAMTLAIGANLLPIAAAV